MTLSRRAFVAAGTAAAGLASGAPAWSAPQIAAPQGDPFWFVNAELRPIAAQMQTLADTYPEKTLANLEALRRRNGAYAKPPLPSPAFEMKTLPGRNGGPAVTVYVINAAATGDRPGILHTHGGGFIAGTASSAINGLQGLAAALDCVIVTVDYRLAPETPYSGSMEDNYTALRWLHDSAPSLGVNPDRLAVMGESAGGGHAALLAIMARDRGEVPLAFQLLTYPMLDDRTGSTRMPPDPIGRLWWDSASNRFGWRCFLGQEPGSETVPVAAVPARTVDLSGLPPTFIGVGSIDLFVQEDIDYARRLMEAGVPTELLVAPGAFHGFDVIAPQTQIATQFNEAKIRALRTALA